MLKDHWITDSGECIFCDGDAGIDVPCHQMIVQQTALSKMLDVLEEQVDSDPLCRIVVNAATDSYGDVDVIDPCGFRTLINDETDAAYSAGEISEECYDDWSGVIQRKYFKDDSDLVDVAFYAESVVHDTREWAVLKWDWIWLSFDSIAIRRANSETLKRLVDGLDTIAWEELGSLKSGYRSFEWFLQVMLPRQQSTGRIARKYLGNVGSVRDRMLPV